jgi:hypothetical protein
LQALLARDSDVDVVGVAADRDELVRAVLDLRPRVSLLGSRSVESPCRAPCDAPLETFMTTTPLAGASMPLTEAVAPEQAESSELSDLPEQVESAESPVRAE